MWKLLGIIFTNFTLALTFRNESFIIPDILDILKAKSFTDVSEICREHIQEYLNEVLNKQEWALRMIDSMTKFPDGVLLGHFSIPGHYDECVNAVNDKFSGKHCMAKLQPELPHKGNKQIKLIFSYGICFPSTCTARDIENAIKNKKSLENLIKVNVSEKDCSISGFRSFRTEDWTTVGIIVAFCLLAVGSTAYDVYQKLKIQNENPNHLWSSFSLYSNGKQLFRISQSSSQLKCLHGIRFFSMCWVILAHAYFSYLSGAPINIVELPDLLLDKSFVPISNGFVSVDSFFFLSGLLVCLIFFRDIAKKGSFDVPVAFIHRYLRLTPPFALLMLVQATIISRIGNGPFWNAAMETVENGCRESWWTGLLYVQNYVKPQAMCLGQAWYLSADMQMYWLSPLILYPLLWFPAFAPYFILLLGLAAAFTNFAIAFVNNLGPNLLNQGNFLSLNQFKLEYVPFHTRMAPWFVGVATGYIICGLQAKKIRLNLSKFWVVIGWVAAFALLGGSLFGIERFLSSEYSNVESAFYLAFHRVGWALGLSWVVVACVGGYGGPINDLLSLDFFQPLARLSYCNFLIHMTLQTYKMNSLRTNHYIRHFDVVYGYFGDLFFSNLVSIPVTLLFELPFTSIDRYFFQKLVIFPLPKLKHKVEKENLKEKPQTFVDLPRDAEEGKVNPSFG